MQAKETLNLIDRALTPMLEQQGYGGQNLKYSRQSGHVLTLVSVQVHSDRERCCVNLGAHLDFLPMVSGRKRVEHPDCEIRKRLTPQPELADYWWSLTDGEVTSVQITETVSAIGIPFLDQFTDFPKAWEAVEVGDIEDGSFVEKFPGMTDMRAALLFGRVHDHLGNTDRCRAFAEYGLSIVQPVAVGPRVAFKKLLRKTGSGS